MTRRRGATWGMLIALAAVSLAACSSPATHKLGLHHTTKTALHHTTKTVLSSATADSTITVPSATTTSPAARSTTTSTISPTSTSTTTIPTSTSPTTTQPTSAPVGPGTASLAYSGVLSGQLVNAVSYCQPRPNAESEITVNGTLNGTPWVLYVQSYDGESGVWQVLTGQAGGNTGMVGQGYGVTATYPATVSGVTQIDWANGATFDVPLASGSGQTPAGNVEVQGTVDCG